MAYFLDLFSPETYETFGKSDRNISGFRIRQLNAAKKIQPGDKLLCYMTKLSRWFGILEVASECFIDHSPIFYPDDDPFVVRFKVSANVWLPKEKSVPIHESTVWNELSFTKGHDHSSPHWTGKIRASLVEINKRDGDFLTQILITQLSSGTLYPVDEEEWQKFTTQRIRHLNKFVSVSIPAKEDEDKKETIPGGAVRESSEIQSLLAQTGEKMGFKIWIPKSDRSLVLRGWEPEAGVLLEALPLNYDETTLRTIEQIDVIWLKGRSISRAFEIEHTTAVYSGLLRMADLLALQPNMDIRLHIVAPSDRREKVFQEIQRPVFSLLEKGPLSEFCTFISYDGVKELGQEKHLSHLSDSVLDEFAEEAT